MLCDNCNRAAARRGTDGDRGVTGARSLDPTCRWSSDYRPHHRRRRSAYAHRLRHQPHLRRQCCGSAHCGRFLALGQEAISRGEPPALPLGRVAKHVPMSTIDCEVGTPRAVCYLSKNWRGLFRPRPGAQICVGQETIMIFGSKKNAANAKASAATPLSTEPVKPEPVKPKPANAIPDLTAATSSELPQPPAGAGQPLSGGGEKAGDNSVAAVGSFCPDRHCAAALAPAQALGAH